jgi:autotransporter-associated beta strand protein
VVEIPAGVSVEVSTDSDATYVNGLKGVNLTAETSTFIFNQPSDIEWGCAVFGEGTIIKRTAATITLRSNQQTDLKAKFGYGYAAYCTMGGVVIEKGTLITPQTDAQIYSFGPVVMSNDTALVISPSNRTHLAALNGYGTVSNTAKKATGQYFQVGMDGTDRVFPVSHFYGRINGGGIKWYSTGTTYLYNNANTFEGNGFVVYGRSSGEGTNRGHLYFTTFGKKGKASAIGGSYAALESRIGGCYHYIGSGDETTDKGFTWRAQVARQVVMDAGPTGGVTFAEGWYQYSGEEKDTRMGRLRITGDNKKPCIVTGTISTSAACNGTNYTTYITKDGTGTWRFANDSNAQKGALAIKDGTLQFTSIAEHGENCALGLSTILHEDYQGYRDDSRAVDYAFLLGGNGTFPTFEYMGGKAASCSTRPLALTGTGGRLSSSGTGSALAFNGVYSLNAGEKTLMLGGDSDANNVISGIASGSGSVAVAKDGPGRWALHGTNVISGTLRVKEGTLELWDGYMPNFTWYRLVIKKVFTSNATFTPEFAMYDDEGSNRVAGLRYRLPPEYVQSGSAAAYLPGDPADLEPGEALCHGAQSTTKVYIYGNQANDLTKLFDGTDTSWRLLTAPSTSYPSTESADKYVYVVMHLPADTPSLKRFDIDVGNSKNGTTQQTIQKFAIEASFDGKKWVAVTDDYTVETPAWKWLSGDDFVAGHPIRQNAGFAMAQPPNYNAAESEHVLDAVTSISVSTGALLVAKGDRKTANGLTIDCASGVGRIEGIDFAANGTLYLENLPEDADEITLEADLSALSAASLENLNNYVVMKGGRRTGRVVTVTATSIKIAKRGFVVILK